MFNKKSEVIAWNQNVDVTRLLLDNIQDEWLTAKYAEGARTVGEELAHIHAVRSMFIEVREPITARNLVKLPKSPDSVEQIKKGLKSSDLVVGGFISKSVTMGSIRDWDGPVVGFVGFLIAHESHHRGLIMASLRVAGHEMPSEVVREMWDWRLAKK